MANHSNAVDVATAASQSAYETASRDLYDGIDHLKGLVEHLRKRLGGVLVSAQPEKECADVAKTLKPERAPLIEALEQQTARVDSISRDVDDILRRLCL